MTGVQAPYFESVECLTALRRDRKVPAGYERNFKRGRQFFAAAFDHLIELWSEEGRRVRRLA